MKTALTTGKLIATTSLVSALALAGCASTDGSVQTRSDINSKVSSLEGATKADQNVLGNMQATGRPTNMTVRKGLFLGDKGFYAGSGSPLPSRFETPDGISLSVAQAINIEQFSQKISDTTGIKVDYSDIIRFPADLPGPDSASGQSGMADSTSNSSADQSGSGSKVKAQTAPFLHPSDRTFRIHYQGPLSGLLDQVSRRIGADWTYEGGVIRFQGPQTITYTLWALPTTMSSTSGVGNGSGQTFGGSTPATTTSQFNADYWAPIEAGLKAIVPNGMAGYALNKSNGTIIVTADKATQRRVQEYVATENKRLSRQVAVKVDVVAFTSTNADDRATSITGILNKLKAGFKFGLSSPVNMIDGGVGIGATRVKGDTNGSGAILNALSTQGRVSILNSVTVTATNDTPTPVSVTSDKAYLAGSSQTTASDGTQTTDLETGIVSTGMNMVVTPRILSTGDIVMQYTMNLTDLKGIQDFSAPDGTSSVQLPETSSRNFMQTVNMADGESLIIASYRSQNASTTTQGPFDPRLWGLGGKMGSNLEDTRIMVLMTPVIVAEQNKPKVRR